MSSIHQPSEYQSFSHDGWKGQVASELQKPLEQFQGDWPDEFLNDSSFKKISLAHRTGILVFRGMIGGYDSYLKHFEHRKTGKNNRDNLWQNIRWRFGSSRALHNHRINLKLIELGFGAAKPLLAARKTDGFKAEDIFISQAVEGQPLQITLQETDPETHTKLLIQAGQTIARLHNNNFIHGDLLPYNILLSPDHSSLTFLDNDRTQHYPFGKQTHQKNRNIQQMLYRLLSLFTWHTIKPFTDTYYKESNLTPSQGRTQLTYALKQVRKRQAKNKTKRFERNV